MTDKILLTKEGCPYCTEAKKRLKKDIDSGKIGLMNYDNNPEAKRLVKNLNIKGVPAILVKDNVTQQTQVCEIGKDYKTLYCPGNKELKI